MPTYPTEQEILKAVAFQDMFEDGKKDPVGIRGVLTLTVQQTWAPAELALAKFELIEHVKAEIRSRLVDQVKTREVVEEVERLREIKLSAWRCTNWMYHQRDFPG